VNDRWPSASAVPALVFHIRDAQQRVEVLVGSLDDHDLRDSSLLPGWSRGHVISHLARHAEANTRVLHAARHGEVISAYPGGQLERAQAIEAGALRPPEDARAELKRTGRSFALACTTFPVSRWSQGIEGNAPATKVLLSRWRELEVHGVDLDLGLVASDWSADFVDTFLPIELARLSARAPGVGMPADFDQSEALAWLLGRGKRGLPLLPPWG
jgi:maleylpyruvate isomerase